MNEIIVNNTEGKCMAQSLSAAVQKAAEGDVIRLDGGNYYLSKPVCVQDKINLTIDGAGSIIVPRFCPDKYYEYSTDAFRIKDCKNITIKNMKVCASLPSNTAGIILASTPEYVDVELFPSVPLTGGELCLGGITFYENHVTEMIPQYHFGASGIWDESRLTTISDSFRSSAPLRLSAEYEMIGKNRLRIRSSQNWEMLKPGTKCNIYHAYYGNCAFVFTNTEGALIENIHISNFGGMGFLIMPRSSDFLFRGVRIAPEDMEHQPYSVCSDGIHIIGIGGKLVLDRCRFELLGDDIVNLHTYNMTVKSVDRSEMELFLDKKHSIFPRYYAQKGDILRVYDKDDMSCKGTVTVSGFDNGRVHFEDADCAVLPGDYVVNSFFYANFIMKDCHISRTRSRVVIQTADRCEIYGNTFTATNTSLYLSASFRSPWKEAGGVKNADIYGNRFVSSEGNVLYVRVVDLDENNMKHIHRDIKIHDNQFIDIANKAVNVKATDHLSITGNSFLRCSKEPIAVRNCTDVAIKNNTYE